jgi:hypothetical protein
LKHFTERVRWLPSVAVVVMGLGLFGASQRGAFDRIDGPVVTWLAHVLARGPLKLRPTEDTSLLTLVEINDVTVEQGWPLKALDYAIFFRALLPTEPALVAVAEVMEIREISEFFAALESYILRTPRLLLAWETASVDKPGTAFEAKPVLRRVQGAVTDVPIFEGAASAPAEPFSLIAAQGFINLADDPGQIVRRVPLLMRAGRDLLPAFTLRAAMQFYGVAADEVVVTIGKDIMLAGKVKIPIDAEGMLLLPPVSRARFSRLGFDDFLVAAERRETSRHPLIALGGMQNEVVYLGRTDADSRKYLSPEGAAVSRAEIMAAGLDCIQRGLYMIRSPLSTGLAIVGSALMLMTAMKRMRRWRSVVVAAAFLAVYCVVAAALLNVALQWPPFTMMAVLVVAVVAYRLWLPTRIQRAGRRRAAVGELLRERAVKRFRPEDSAHGNPRLASAATKEGDGKQNDGHTAPQADPNAVGDRDGRGKVGLSKGTEGDDNIAG